ncbi:peptidase [Microtetraspora sp. NBRC 13810]|uniref:trypsin-like serine peptidase n=1 Tax=Microtetraspora sp. NBRC 13810 TaxID=3030990 RepID=UPI0024A38C79|nr:hypothetical protein [Microtetraspora sp. NBRC 13810]GLW06282.1 peptidase [Microtetraspora sp. NBRC 13810]
MSALGGLTAASVIIMSAFSGMSAAAEPSRKITAEVMSVPMARTGADVAKVEEYWRPDRLSKADNSTPKTADPKPVAPARAEVGSTAVTAAAKASPTAAAAPSTTESATAPGLPAPWTVQPAPPAKALPVSTTPRTIGKVFFRIGAKEYWCSASAVRAQNRSLVATAGHCAFDVRSGKPVEYWIFVPNYRPGQQPDGIYVGHTLSLHLDYAGKGDYDYDYAFITVNKGFKWQAQKDAKGQLTYRRVSVGYLQDNVGGQGITAGRGTTVAATAFGYPAGAQPDGSRPYDGHSLKWCSGTTKKVVSPTYQLEQGISIKECDFTAGASGGPWLVVYNAGTGLGFLDGINSLSWNRKGGKNDEISSPYFNTITQAIYNRAQSIAIN